MTSFNKQQRFLTTTQNLPSVWNYDTARWHCDSRIKTAQSASIGKSKRSSLQINPKVPGPGSYDLVNLTKFKAPNPVLIGKPKDLKTTNIPGPGSYSANESLIMPANPKFSMTGSNFQPKSERKPGPSDYSPNYNMISKTDPAIKFPQEKRDRKNEHINYPGPNKYNPQSKDEKSVKYSFGSEQKFHLEQLQFKQRNKLPGPGQYRIHIDKKVRGYKFLGSKRQTLNDVCLPGPGDYSLQKYMNKKSVACIIGTSPRLKSQNHQIPGPIYQETPVQKYKQSMRQTAVSFTKSKKQRQYQTVVPGPGAYQLERSLIDKNGVTLKGQVNKQRINKGPGPCDYNPNYNTVLDKSPCARISSMKSKSVINTKEGIPGPCSYKTEDDYRIKSFFFPKQNKSNLPKDITPGPGHYEAKTQFKNIKS